MLARAIQHFNHGVSQLPLHWRLWTYGQGLCNAGIPLVLLPAPEAIAALVAFAINCALMVVLVARTGFSRVIGLGHIMWIPLGVYHLTRLGAHEATSALYIWMLVTTSFNALSFAIDLSEAVRFARGDRADRAPLP